MKKNKANSKMNERFKELVDRMPLLLRLLLEQPPTARDDIGIIQVPQKGVYVLFENNKPIYVGRSNRLKQRIKEHSQTSSDQYSATLALRIAKQNFLDIQGRGRRQTNEQLMKNNDFVKEFSAAKERISRAKYALLKLMTRLNRQCLKFMHRWN
jgi:predicted GIY-YIG superfamily endonuclease